MAEQNSNSQVPYEIHDDDELYRKLYRLRKLKQEQQEDDVQRSKELKETNDWYQSAKQARDNEIERVKYAVEQYASNQLSQNPHWRYRSRNGSVSVRHETAWTHDDEKLKNHIPNEFIQRKVKWGDFKKTLTPTDDGRAVDENGEVVDGVSTERQARIQISQSH